VAKSVGGIMVLVALAVLAQGGRLLFARTTWHVRLARKFPFRDKVGSSSEASHFW